jgi:DUF971 family protein
MTAPNKIRFNKGSGSLTLHWPDGLETQMSGEFLRVHSRSAEVVGHGPGQEVLEHGKQGVRIEKIESTGRYALKLFFSDGHDTGLYTWTWLRTLAESQDDFWETYLGKLHRAGLSRAPNTQAVKLIDPEDLP